MSYWNWRWAPAAAATLLFAALPALSQARAGRGDAQASPYQFETSDTDPPPVVTHHTITANGKELSYTAEVGKIPVPDEAGKTEGHMFYVAYTLDNPDKSHPRPVTFSYNGGPGSDSAYVHMGGFGPRRVKLNADATLPNPPYQIVDNQDTWLDSTDLVFIDAIGTGYSRATSMANLTKTSSAMGDLQAFSEFIRIWLKDNHRVDSPVILAGESYGTFRSAGLAGELLNHHIAVSGVVLVSTVLNMQTLSPSMSDDRPYWLAFPTLTAIAYEHKKLPADLLSKPLPEVVQQSEDWAQSKYEHYLDMGDTLQGAARQTALSEMSRLCGLPVQFLDDNNMRINTSLFSTELLRPEKEFVGRYDGSLTGTPRDPGSMNADYDASDLLEIPYLNQYVKYLNDELGYKSDTEYGDRGMGGAGITAWNYNISSGRGGFPGGGRGAAGGDVSPLLESAFAKDPSMRLMLVEGYYDQATPMFEADYAMKHLFITPAEQSHIITHRYYSGHMVYTHDQSRAALHHDFDAFVDSLAFNKQ